MAIRPESGVTLEEDNRYEEMWHWGAAVLDLCNLPVEEYMKPMTVIGVGGGGEGGGDESSSATKTYTLMSSPVSVSIMPVVSPAQSTCMISPGL